MYHSKQVVKVNAYVDEKIVPVIEAMSKLPNIVTDYSCQDNRTDTDSGIARAYITFHFKDEHENWQELGNICEMLSKAIADYRHSELSVQWKGGSITGIFEFNT